MGFIQFLSNPNYLLQMAFTFSENQTTFGTNNFGV